MIPKPLLKVLYKPIGLFVSVLGGILAGFAFKQLWKFLGHADEAPQATDPRRRWVEVLPAAAVQGALFGLVKAAVDRASATGVAKATGSWPT